MANIFQRALGGYIGATGHGLQQLGTMLKAPQIVPGGFGAQMQIVGRRMNPLNPPAAKDREINWQPYNIAETYQQYSPLTTTGGLLRATMRKNEKSIGQNKRQLRLKCLN